jgi:hypothetical protein
MGKNDLMSVSQGWISHIDKKKDTEGVTSENRKLNE